jgi:hypothetical protein
VHQHRVHPVSLALAALLWAALVPEAAAQSPQRIGIVVTTAVNLDESEADELTAALGQALEQSLGVVVTAGAETRRRLPREGLPAGCVGEAACRADLGQRLDADELLMTVVARVGDRIQIDITWVDVASGKVASRPAIVLEGDADRATVLHNAGSILLPHIQPVPPADEAGQGKADAPPPRSERRMTTAVWIAGGVGAAALAGALGFGYRSYTIDDKGCTADCDSAQDDLRLSNTLADGLAVVGVAAGVTALVLYLNSEEPVPSASSERAGAARGKRPMVDLGLGLGAGPGGFQVSIGGAF